jgi:ribosome recycling factor
MLKEVVKKTEETMKHSIEHLQQELGGIRTGKANPALLDSIKVNYFGQQVPLKQVASIAAPDARLITVQPWDRSIVGDIEKAILASELGLNPQSDGVVIRLPIPQLTQERRRDLAKVVKRLGEDTKITIRNIRRDANERIRKLEKEHEIGEDAMRANQEDVQKLTDRYIVKVDEVVSAKEKEIMEL